MVKNSEGSMKYLFYLSKLYWIGILGLIGTFFSELVFFKYLCFFGIFAFLDIALNFSVLKCTALQIVGMIVIRFKFKENMPSVDNYKSEISYCLPFKGEWVAVNGCFKRKYSHSWNIPTQRYAYDFIILDETSKSYNGYLGNVTSYYCYDKEILSPANGIVVEIKNNSQDSEIFSKENYISKAKHIAGNYIVIRHSENEYSTLAHLKKDSIRVKVGDVLSKGEVIALCGNTGNSSEPHLHFQLQTSQSFYSGVGLPICFDKICINEVKGYEKYDPRPHMDFNEIPLGYVTRGFGFRNME